jgi:hypothetical protein
MRCASRAGIVAGIDHKGLTFRHNGIDRRLADVDGQVVKSILERPFRWMERPKLMSLKLTCLPRRHADMQGWCVFVSHRSLFWLKCVLHRVIRPYGSYFFSVNWPDRTPLFMPRETERRVELGIVTLQSRSVPLAVDSFSGLSVEGPQGSECHASRLIDSLFLTEPAMSYRAGVQGCLAPPSGVARSRVRVPLLSGRFPVAKRRPGATRSSVRTLSREATLLRK